MKKYRAALENRPVLSMVIFAFALLLTNGIISWKFYFQHTTEFIVQLLAESHGMVLDVLIFGALFFWINSSFDRKRAVEQAYEEIEDLRQCLRIDNDEGVLEIQRKLGNAPKNPAASIRDDIKEVYLSQIRHTDYAVLKVLRNVRILNRHLKTKINLSFIELPKAGLSKVNLKGSDLTGFRSLMANFTGADLRQCSLNTANLSLSYMESAILKNCHAQNAVFHGANLVKADFENSVLINTDFSGSNLSNVNFRSCDLFSADFSDATIIHTDFRGCKNLKVNQVKKASMLHGCKFDPEFQKQLDFFTGIELSKKATASTADPQERQLPIQRIAV